MLEATLLNDFQAKLTAESNEKFKGKYGLNAAVKQSTANLNYIDPESKAKLATATGQQKVDIPAFKDQTITVSTEPSFTIPANNGDTDVYNLTAYNICSGFRYHPSMHADNVASQEWYVKNVMDNIFQAMGAKAEEIYQTVLNAAKTQKLGYTLQASNNSGVYTFDESTDVLKIDLAASKGPMYYQLNEIMANNLLGGNYHFVTSLGGTQAMTVEMLKNGVNNATNLAWGLTADNLKYLHESSQISAGSDLFGGFAFRDGSIGVFETFPFDFIKGTKLADMEWSMGEMAIPYANLRPNIFINRAATNGSGLISGGANNANLQMTTYTEVMYWLRFYVAVPYNSDLATRPNPIVKLTGLTA